MYYKDYPGDLKTYVVHHTEGTGEQGGSGIQELEIVGSSESREEAQEIGRQKYPPSGSGWDWDNYTININTATDLGKALLQNFYQNFEKRLAYSKAHPELFTTYVNIDGISWTLENHSLLDPKPDEIKSFPLSSYKFIIFDVSEN